MKLNNWSIVKTPTGVSLRHIENGKISNDGEVCVCVVDGVLNVLIYRDGIDSSIARIVMPTDSLAPYQPKKTRRVK